MPRIEIQDWFGSPHRCDSSDPDVIKAWLYEHAKMFASADTRLGEIRMRIWPIFGPDMQDGQPVADWPGQGQQDYRLASEAFSRLAEWLAGEIENDAIIRRAREEPGAVPQDS